MNEKIMLLRNYLLAALVFGVLAVPTRAGDIYGNVFDNGRKTSLPGAAVTIVENGRSTVTTNSGRFQFVGLSEGTYTLVVRYLGYDERSITISVPSTGAASAEIAMGDDVVKLEEFRVEGYREGRSKALQQKRTANNLRDIISADSVGALPDRNVADALSRLPGVNIDIEGGEGRWVTIRGLEPTLNNVTLNGATMATPDTDGRAGRAMPLDVVGSSQISQIQIIKAVTPDMDGHSIGGTINIVTGTAFDTNERMINGSVEGGSNSAASGSFYALESSFSDLFGEKKDVGIAAAFNLSKTPYREDEIQGDFKLFNNKMFLETYELHPTEGNKDRTGFNLDFDYRPAGGAEMYVRTLVNTYSQQRTQAQNNMTLRRDPTFVSDTKVQVNRMRYDARQSYNESEQRLFNITTGGSKQFDAWTLKGEVTFSKAKEWNPVSLNAQFRTGNVNQPSPLFAWDWTDYYPTFDQTLQASNPALFPMRRLITETRDIYENTWAPRLDLRWDSNDIMGGRTGFVQAGIKVISRKRVVDRESTRPNNGSATLASLGAGAPGQSLYDGRYMTNVTVDVNKVFDFYYANPSGFTVDPVDEGQNEVEDDYNTNEKIFAAYIMSEVKLSNKLTGMIGARFEQTKADISSYEMRLNGSGAIIGVFPVKADFSYDNFLPNLQLKYDVSERQVVRFAVTGTLGRPRYEDTASQSVLEYAPLVIPDNPAFPNTGSVELGNPDLQPYESLNFDFSFDHYFQKGGLFSVAVFHKAIDNPIYTYRATRDDILYNGLGFETLELQSVRNAASGSVTGVEVNLQVPFNAFIDGFWGRFGFDANLTSTKSEAKLNADPSNPRDITVPFFRQPDNIYNLGLYFQGPKVAWRVAYNSQSNSIREISDTADFDIYQKPRHQLDLQVSYKFTENYQIYANWQNVSDEPTSTSFGESGRLIRKSQIYGSNVRAGIRFDF